MSLVDQLAIEQPRRFVLRVGYRVLFLSAGILAVVSLLSVVVVDDVSTPVLALSAFTLAFVVAALQAVMEGQTIRTGLWLFVAAVLVIVIVDPFTWDIVGPVTVVMAVISFGWVVLEISHGLGLSNDEELSLQPPNNK